LQDLPRRQDERRLLRERRATLAEPAQLGAHVAPQGAGGQPCEGEQEHGCGATDEQDAPRRGAPGGARVGERIIGRGDAELPVGGRQAGLRAALGRKQPVDVPDVGAAGVEGGGPAVAAREQQQRW
jgi:hypothetical protein